MEQRQYNYPHKLIFILCNGSFRYFLFIFSTLFMQNRRVLLHLRLIQRIEKLHDDKYQQITDAGNQGGCRINPLGYRFRLYRRLRYISNGSQDKAADAARQRLSRLSGKGIYRVNRCILPAPCFYLLLVNDIRDKRPDNQIKQSYPQRCQKQQHHEHRNTLYPQHK